MERANKSVGQKIRTVLNEGTILIVLAALIILFGVLSKNFLTTRNLTNILVQNVHVCVVSTAVMLLMVSGSTDLSIGYQVSTGAVVVTMLISKHHLNMWIAILACIVVCAVFGLFNGVMSQKLKSHSMMITLGTMAIYQGISYEISQAKSFFDLPNSYLILGQGRIGGVIPVNGVIALVIILIVGFFMSKTFIGRHVYAVGDNPEASRLAGVKVAKVKLLTFVFAGVLVGIAAVLLSARAGSADSTTGVGIEFTGITACVLGGCSLKGGVGSLWKVIVAVFVLGVLSNGMQLVGLDAYTQYIAKGAIMLLAIYLGNRNKTDAFAM